MIRYRARKPGGNLARWEDLTKANVARKAAAGLARNGEPFTEELGLQGEIARRSCHVRMGFRAYRTRSSQKATALAAATLSESTPWVMGIFTV